MHSDHNGETEDRYPAPHTNTITCVTDMWVELQRSSQFVGHWEVSHNTRESCEDKEIEDKSMIS